MAEAFLAILSWAVVIYIVTRFEQNSELSEKRTEDTKEFENVEIGYEPDGTGTDRMP